MPLARGHWAHWQRYRYHCVGVLHQMEKKSALLYTIDWSMCFRGGPMIPFQCPGLGRLSSSGRKDHLAGLPRSLSRATHSPSSIFSGIWASHLSGDLDVSILHAWQTCDLPPGLSPRVCNVKGQCCLSSGICCVPSHLHTWPSESRGEERQKSLFPIQVNWKSQPDLCLGFFHGFTQPTVFIGRSNGGSQSPSAHIFGTWLFLHILIMVQLLALMFLGELLWTCNRVLLQFGSDLNPSAGWISQERSGMLCLELIILSICLPVIICQTISWIHGYVLLICS